MTVDPKRWKELKEKERLLKEAADVLRVEEKDLTRVVERFKGELGEMEEKLNSIHKS